MGQKHHDGHRYDAIVVGTGMGGAVIARELAVRGSDVLVVETGEPASHLGSFKDALRMYDGNALTRTPKRSTEGTILWRTLMAGGSTVVSCGNCTCCLEHELAELGVDLSDDLAAMEIEMGLRALEEEKLSDMGRRIREGARDLGYNFELMPKTVDPEKCTACGNCVFGCVRGAKWTAERPLNEAVEHGAEVLYGITIERALRSNGHVTGVAGRGPEGEFEAAADAVVLAAGGFGTAPILAGSGIKDAGSNLFIDILVNVYASTDESFRTVEPQMSLVDTEFHAERGFLLSPFLQYPRATRMIEAGPTVAARSVRHTFGMMVKTADDPAGRVYPDGTVSKPVTAADQSRLDDGVEIATEVLVAAGVRPDSVVVTKPQGAHPGGTAAVGTVVDSDLQTEVDGLFVGDASVLPEAPGMPPMLTIGALGRRLGRSLA
jgi:choline dehydrogenase-like flavoprotein